MSIRGVKFYAWGPGMGYGDAAKAYMLGLVRAGVPVTWTPMVEGARWVTRGLHYEPFTGKDWPDPELAPLCNLNIPYDRVVAHIVPEYFPALIEQEQGRPVIGCTVWESECLPEHWPALLNSCTSLIVPCHWNREVFRRCGVVRPINVVPHILPEFSDTLDAAVPEPVPVRPDDLVFYTIGTWTTRKAMSLTVQAYLRAFTAADPVVLVIKTTARDFTRRQPWLELLRWLGVMGLYLVRRPQWAPALVRALEPLRGRSRTTLRRLLAGHPSPPRIILCTADWPRAAIEWLHHRGDCFVSLCHAEGWGLGAFEAAGVGNPVVMTGFGGQLDFLPAELAYLVEFEPVEARDTVTDSLFQAGHRWAEPSVAHGAELLRHVFLYQDEARERAEKLRRDMHANFGEAPVIEKLLNLIGQPP